MTRVVVAGELASDEGHAQATLRRFLQPALGAALLALAFALIGLLTSMLRAVDTSVYRPDDAWLVALVLLASLPVALVHRWPLAVLAVVMAAVVAEALAGYAVVGVGVWAAGAALFVAAAFGSTWELVLSGLLAAGGLVALYVGAEGDLEWTEMAVSWAAFSFTWTIGAIVRVYRAVAARAQRDRPARGRCPAGARCQAGAGAGGLGQHRDGGAPGARRHRAHARDPAHYGGRADLRRAA